MTDKRDAAPDRIKLGEIRPDEHCDEEVAAKHEEINWDLRAGRQGLKHFEDVLDEVHSNPSQHTESVLTAAERDEAERMLTQLMTRLQLDVTAAILSQDMKCESVRKGVSDSGQVDAFVIVAKDAVGRRFETTMTWDQGISVGSVSRSPYLGIVDLIVKQLFEARAKYHARAGLS